MEGIGFNKENSDYHFEPWQAVTVYYYQLLKLNQPRSWKRSGLKIEQEPVTVVTYGDITKNFIQGLSCAKATAPADDRNRERKLEKVTGARERDRGPVVLVTGSHSMQERGRGVPACRRDLSVARLGAVSWRSAAHENQQFDVAVSISGMGINAFLMPS
ncbi:hypothetical protein GWI33_012372 [Rhynchophorus ferrugineus]|uniref:Uncharacterized protein n=1 Tax=Rhynchophorus ferrugineus TaxID=354439 RepID=A0A834MAY6_RHYFE|nr:hypothetical protein GWI33_012372 [Rhynchophorus ferrugineus]